MHFVCAPLYTSAQRQVLTRYRTATITMYLTSAFHILKQNSNKASKSVEQKIAHLSPNHVTANL